MTGQEARSAAWGLSFEVWVKTPSAEEPWLWSRTRNAQRAERLVDEIARLNPQWEVELRRFS